MNRRNIGCCIVVVLLAINAMGRGALNEFVVWDDPKTIQDNPLLHPPTLAGLRSIWTSPADGLYVPLTYTAWWTIASITNKPFAFHLASLIAHCIASVLVYLILRQLIRAQLAACFGAMIFAVHPLQVESVAWASGLKDVLAGLLALAAIHQHIAFNSVRSKVLAAIFFALAMLAKPSAASAILIALILDMLLLNRSARASLRSLIPWMVIALPLLIVARGVQETPFVPHVALWKRPLIAGDAIWFYLEKLVAPIHLAIDHGRTPASVLSSEFLSLRCAALLALITILTLLRGRRLLAAMLIFIAGLIFNLGLAPFQFQIHSTVAEHYAYLSMLGPALATAWLVARVRNSSVVVLIAVVALTEISIRQTIFWSSSEKLLRRAIAVNPRSIASRDNLGRLLGQRGDLRGANEQLRASLAIDPDNPEALHDLAMVELNQGNLDACVADLDRSIRLNLARGVDVLDDQHALFQLRYRRAMQSQTRPSPATSQ